MRATAPAAAAPDTHRHGRTRVGLLVLRAIVTVHVVAVFAQPVFAGVYLSGDYDMLAAHATGANVVSYLGYAQVLAALLVWALDGPRWPTVASLVLVGAETGQYFAGMAGQLDLHLPLGVAIVAGALLMLVALWRSHGMAEPRR